MPAKAAKPRPRPTKAATVGEYLAQLDPKARKALARLRSQIKAAAPQAQERISYGIPTYWHGGPLIHFAAQPKHLALYGVSKAMLREFRKELRDFEVSGTTVRFQPEGPLPASLVKRMVRLRVRENEGRLNARAKR